MTHLFQELEVEQILAGQRLLADDSLHGLHVLANGIASVQLVGHLGGRGHKDEETRV